MPITGEYEPSTSAWVADQVAEYEESGGTRAATLMDTGIPVIIVTMLGARSGKVRKIGLMRVEHEGEYALVASKGGAPENPGWYANVVAHPVVMIQDGPEPHDFMVGSLRGRLARLQRLRREHRPRHPRPRRYSGQLGVNGNCCIEPSAHGSCSGVSLLASRWACRSFAITAWVSA